MKTKVISLALIFLFFYSCSENTNSDKKVITEEELETITEQQNNK